MTSSIKVGDISIDVVQKDIENIHLSVNPPNGDVRIAAPLRTAPETLRVFAISKLDWIKNQKKKLLEQERETSREYIDRESHFLWGERYMLKLEEADEKPSVTLKHRKMILRVRAGSSLEKRRLVLREWYRSLLRSAAEPLIADWEPRIGVNVERFFIQRMKTKWGSCNAKNRSIRVNLELVKKPKECLEYIVVHEMVHMLEPTHNKKFVSLMNELMPDWNESRELLNRLPVHSK